MHKEKELVEFDNGLHLFIEAHDTQKTDFWELNSPPHTFFRTIDELEQHVASIPVESIKGTTRYFDLTASSRRFSTVDVIHSPSL